MKSTRQTMHPAPELMRVFPDLLEEKKVYGTPVKHKRRDVRRTLQRGGSRRAA